MSSMTPSNSRIAFFASVALVLCATWYLGSQRLQAAPPLARMPITHLLLVSFKPETSQKTIKDLSEQVISFKDTCLDPKTQKPYVLGTKGGINNSPEGSNKAMTHGFIVEFKDDADRRYFLEQDPAHKAFVEAIIPVNNDFLTLDFTEGVYLADSTLPSEQK